MRQEAINTMRKREAWAKRQAALGLIDAGDAKKELREARAARGKKVRPTTFNSCPECHSGNVMYRMRANGYVCRRCGHLWPKEEPPAKGKARK